MSKYGHELAIAALLRSAKRAASRMGVELHIDPNGCGCAKSSATSIENMLMATDEEFATAISRATWIGDLGREIRTACMSQPKAKR
jgi:hypothetical protein